MSKRTEKDGKLYRVRRGVLVEIPKEWLGNITTPGTIRKRPSKASRKLRKILKSGLRVSYGEKKFKVIPE